MSKKTRAERRAEEARALAEMDEALRRPMPDGQNGKERPRPAGEKKSEEPLPPTARCEHCGAELKNGVCPRCSSRGYVPMSPQKIRRIRWIVGGICVAVFLFWILIKRA